MHYVLGTLTGIATLAIAAALFFGGLEYWLSHNVPRALATARHAALAGALVAAALAVLLTGIWATVGLLTGHWG